MNALPLIRLALPLVLLSAASAEAAELALKRVMLSSGGVGYFEYEAKVQGAETLDLTVRRDQVDDVLKSVVVYDDKGGVGDIALPGEDPLRDVFRELPFDEVSLQEPGRLYNTLRGAEIEIGGATAIRGRIIGVAEEIETTQYGRITKHRLSVATSEGIRSLLLHEAGPISFTDPKLKAQVEQALRALMQNRARERRTLTVRTFGEGARTLRVAYVVEAPLWKASYRLTLGGGATADLQGWALLENRSGEDWKDVELTLVTGNPVTFRQALYTAYYVNRPEVPVEVMGRVLPRMDSLTFTTTVGTSSGARAQAAPPPPPASAPMASRGMMAEQAYSPKRAADIMAAESQEATTQASYTIPKPATVANGHSLLVPLVARAVPAEQIALYQRQLPQHPLAAVRITNDSGVSLPPGVLTLYERSPKGEAAFVGDARLGPFPAGEKRLLSYAVDQKITVQRKDEETTTLSRARLSEGLLRSSLIQRLQTTYDIAGAEARRVLIDHPQAPGFELVEPKGTIEKGDFGYRLPLALDAGKPAQLVVVEEQTLTEEVALISMPREFFIQYAANAKLPEAQRKAFARLAELAAARGAAGESTARLLTQRKEIETEQGRVRANLGAVPANSDVHRRYLTLLNEQEDRLGKLDADIARAREAEAAAAKALADYIRGLDL